MKALNVFLLIIGLLLIVGCTVDDSDNQELQNQISTLQSEKSQLSSRISTLENSIVQKDQSLSNLQDQLNDCNNEKYNCETEVTSIYSCETDDDCTLVTAGVCWCDDCKEHTLDDPEVIAVNKNLYKCPTTPVGLACAACIGTINYNPTEDAICRMSKCEKR